MIPEEHEIWPNLSAAPHEASVEQLGFRAYRINMALSKPVAQSKLARRLVLLMLNSCYSSVAEDPFAVLFVWNHLGRHILLDHT